ncbi:hypothetical protein F5B22DRAFT_619770 [Xylaria bambusicola]|uniref:uncharacterized protein n=1 Tax=Xylaria bambusicola TaxID=326684 RepID=UPI002007C9B8|nr:uncharacterized protein F5B22DRAFT_619770 [Xylaria bambusicola]KAI0508636.1 hypothetical protein F5B22DRAFT_619770 [Xylaria bambusicola]
MSSLSEPICQALNLSDSKPCTEPAVVWDNLFCRFHGKQCHGLYAGYKKRNGELDGLADEAPQYLKSSAIPLANETFERVEDETVLNEIHSHLFKEYVLLSKVIDARKLHHKHFYPMKLDYGHQAYLDTLSNRRHIVLRALERVVKRTAEVLYAKEKWFEWIEEVQHHEESTREKEAKKVKLEAAMFKRHWKKMQTRLRAQREKEEKQRQEAFLESAYQERINATTEDDEDAEMWDPIEDFLEDERARYVDLIKHFLWMEVLNEGDEDEAKQAATATTDLVTETQDLSISTSAPTKKTKKKSKPKDAKNSAAASKPPQSRTADTRQSQSERAGQTKILDMINSKETGRKAVGNNPEPDKTNIETEEEMRNRLKEGVEKNYDDVRGPILVGSLETPHGTHEKTPPLEDDEIETLMQDIKEIKILLFCRLLLSHASLLPAALRAGSVDEFLKDPEITEADLRDICLKVEQPSLQDIRDACADLLRGDEPESEEALDDENEDISLEDIFMHDRRYGHLQGAMWYYESMLAQRSKILGEPAMSLRELLKPAMKKAERVKVRVLGKSIWNYSSESSMSRQGWLQFSVLAKGCDLRHAVQLCRNWSEFSELNFLASWQYFPASNWVSWGTDRLTKQLHDLGFFPFFLDLGAENFSHHFPAGGSRSQQRRRHDFVESRNILVGHMKRNDSVTRRFLQYVSMRPGELLLVVRDGRTGKIITAPRNEDSFWTLRSKHGIGRASKNEWDIHLSIGPEYFEFVEQHRNWHLGFDDYYEVWLWHFVPGEAGSMLYNVVVEDLRKAWRIAKPNDIYNHQEHFLRTLTRNEKTQRVRLIKPEEQAKSLWDDVRNPNNIFVLTDLSSQSTKTFQGDNTGKVAPHIFYNEADAEEDTVLFPDELLAPNPNMPFKEVSNPITRLEEGAGDMNRYLTKLSMAAFRSKNPFPGEYGDSEESVKSGDSVYDHDDGALDLEPMEDPSGDDLEVVKHWRSPRLWEDEITRINENGIDYEAKKRFSNVGLLDLRTGEARKGMSETDFIKNIRQFDQMTLSEKDRGAAFLKAFHAGDLEPDGPRKYEETCAIVDGILNQQGTDGSQAWFWFALEIFEWLKVRAHYAEYTQDMMAPWPHPFITQDIMKAWAYMAIFFPDLEQCRPATQFFESEEGRQYQQSPLRDLRQRASTLPDRRTKTSFKYRPKKFWKEWDDILQECKKTGTYFADAMPLKWSVVTRPIIAKLYLAGIVSPVLMQNSPLVVPGFAVANTEPHRPDKLDLFIDYADRQKAKPYPTDIPGLVRPEDFPSLLPIARDFAKTNAGARFAVLRLWSAPHFYPAMLGDGNKMGTAFLDSLSRAWRWNFIPKDMPVSEWSMYNNIKIRLDLIKKQLGDRVAHRDDVVLVMAVDQLDLLRHAVAVTFAIQTKPWFREFDLWKSFVNVDIKFLEGLDPYWLS